MTLHADIRSLPFLGGWLALDFANTTSERHSGQPTERLLSYEDLLIWAERVGLLEEPAALALTHASRADPEAAQLALDEALDLREVVYRTFSAVAAGRPVEEADLGRLTEARRAASARHRLTGTEEGYAWTWTDSRGDLGGLVHPVAESAAQLLISGELDRLKECTGEDCNWLFLDASRNRSRRWCDMGDCGNRAKARRHYARHRSAAGRKAGG